MLVNIQHDSRARARRLLVAGIAYMTVMALLVALSIAIYQKAFTESPRSGSRPTGPASSWRRFGDVRMHGALVGQVRSISQDGEQAVDQARLQPEAAQKIPDNISVEILPTTLFGQKYVALVAPTTRPTTALSDGTVIPASRVRTNVEIQTILANLFPLLRSMRPADLNATLYALAHALTGKGDELGETLEELDAYLTR